MSRFVAALVYRKRIGSMARKSILAYCAERANDDGSGVWASKVRIANEVECSKQTVISTLNSFVEEGILKEIGKRKSPHGYTIEYAIVVSAVMALEDAFEDPFSTGEKRGPNLDGSNELTPRGQADGPQEVKPVDPNRPRTVLKPSITPKPPEGADDLFSASGEPIPPSKSVDDLDRGFDEVWNAFPRKPNMPSKAVCKKFYLKALKKVSQSDLLRAVRAYARLREGQDPTYHSRLSKWLQEEQFEGFLTGPEHRWEDLTQSQRNQIQSGNCPASMLVDGQPNAVAAYWLAKRRRAS